ncbi:MAG: hypothetical protein ACYTG5_03010 [Planctomycetota bacterium]|jgi:hypothetical protein
MHRLVWTSLILLPCISLAAQDQGAQSKETYKQLLAEYNTAQKSWMDAYRAAAGAEDEAKVEELLQERPEPKFAARFLTVSKAIKDRETKVECLTWICTRAYQSPEAKEALGVLLDDHIDSPKLVSVIRMVGYIDREKALENYDRIVTGTSNNATKAQALFNRADTIAKGQSDPKILAKAKADYEQVIQLSQEERLVSRAKGAIYELENLAIGMTAPEIEAADLDGVNFKLSDYRGKVVMLDFWGDW